MFEEWGIRQDNDYIVGTIFMELSIAFDSIPHDLLIDKLHAYGLVENALVLMYSYLKKRKQSVRINNTYSSFKTILSGVPHGSVLGPILFNFYINDLFLFIKQATLYNYADDSTMDFFQDFFKFSRVARVALNWVKQNHIIANPEMFHVIFIRKDQTNTS